MSDRTISVPCPTCGSGVGEPCVLTTGQPRNRSHYDRRVIAADLPASPDEPQTSETELRPHSFRRLTLALVNIKLLDKFRLSFVRYTLRRVKLRVAMLTQSQSYRSQPHDPELAMRHGISLQRVRREFFVRCRTNRVTYVT